MLERDQAQCRWQRSQDEVLLSEQSTWPELFRGLWFRASDQDLCEWDRGAVADKGRRQALLRAIYKVETIADPIPGTEPEGVWAELLAAMEADEELSDLARYWRQPIAGTIVPEWRQAQAVLGLTQAGIRGIGVAPQDETETAEAAVAAEIDVSMDHGSGTLVIVPEQ